MTDTLKKAKDHLAGVREITKRDLDREEARLIHSEASDIVRRLAKKHNFNRERRMALGK